MAHAESLPDDVLRAVAEQIGTLLPGVFAADSLPVGRVRIGETFEVWVLEPDAITEATNQLRRLATPTGRWHHQVSLDGVMRSFARSTPLGVKADSWRVTEVFESELARKIDDAIDWVDRNITDDPLVHLLIIPAYQTQAFWLLRDAGDDQVLVLDRPPEFTHLHTDRLLSQGEFLKALRSEQHIIGRLRS